MENGGCVTQGDTIQETQKNMFESVAAYLDGDSDIKNYCLTFEVADA
jgi:predicted RNase H-like HicB family nuclease